MSDSERMEISGEKERTVLSEEERREMSVAEAVLFTMGNSVDAAHLAAALECDQEHAREVVSRLREEYDREHRGMQIVELEDRYQICTRGEYYDALIRVAKVPKRRVLTEVLMETLSIIAYRQPVTRLEVEKIRGVKSDHPISRLLEYDLIYESGRLDAPGRPALFSTTEEFLRRFGLSSAKDLPEIDSDRVAEFREEAEKEIGIAEEAPAEKAPAKEAPAEKAPEAPENGSEEAE